jgi:hypothetical protein
MKQTATGPGLLKNGNICINLNGRVICVFTVGVLLGLELRVRERRKILVQPGL